MRGRDVAWRHKYKCAHRIKYCKNVGRKALTGYSLSYMLSRTIVLIQIWLGIGFAFFFKSSIFGLNSTILLLIFYLSHLFFFLLVLAFLMSFRWNKYFLLFKFFFSIAFLATPFRKYTFCSFFKICLNWSQFTVKNCTAVSFHLFYNLPTSY